MKEQIISFETAILAKEKGFSIEIYKFYYQSTKTSKPYLTTGVEYKSDSACKWDWNLNGGNSGELSKIIPYPNEDKGIYTSAPTQSLLQRWLREKHNINVLVSFDTIDDSETSYVWNIVEYIDEGTGRKKDTWDFYKRTDSFSKQMMWWNTYEEALEAGLLEALKLIKDEKN